MGILNFVTCGREILCALLSRRKFETDSLCYASTLMGRIYESGKIFMGKIGTHYHCSTNWGSFDSVNIPSKAVTVCTKRIMGPNC